MTTTLQLEPEQKKTIEIEVMPLAHRTLNLAVRSPEERTVLVSEIKAAEELKARIEIKFHPTANKIATREVYEAALDTEKQFYGPIDAFVIAGKKAVKLWDTEETLRVQREIREAQEKKDQQEREEKAKRDAEIQAEKDAEEKRQLAEFERLEEEKKKKQALQQSATESGNVKVAGIAAKEVAKIEGQIEQVQKEGAEKLEEIERKAEEAPAPKFNFTPPPQPLKKLVWKAKVTNALLACRSIGEGLIPFDAVEFKQSALNDLGKKHDGITKIPGIEFTQESTGRI